MRALARSLLAGIFVVGGWDSLQTPASKAAAAEHTLPLAKRMGLPADPVQLVKLNGAVQLVGGLMLMAGWLPRLASLALAATLVPTTVSAHRFWEVEDPRERRAQLMQALKNGSIMGGLVMASLDRGGRPSVFWMTRKAAERTGEAVSDAVDRLTP